MAANGTPLSALDDPDLEVGYLIRHLAALETLTTLGPPGAMAQFTAEELFGLFHVLRVQAERVEAAQQLAA